MSSASSGVCSRIFRSLSSCYRLTETDKGVIGRFPRQIFAMASTSAIPEANKKVYVQHAEGNEMMTISFEYMANGKTKSFNLYRKADEPLLSAIERIKLNLAKLSKTKKSKKNGVNEQDESEEHDIQLFQANVPFDPNSSINADVWVEGAIMKLNGDDYIVSRNEPQVTLMRLPSIIMSGFITLPAVEIANCDVHGCKFVWYRQISSQERERYESDPSLREKIVLVNNTYWLYLATGLTYSPTVADIAHHIKVVCHPSDGTKVGPTYTCISGRPVELGPDESMFRERHSKTQFELQDCDRIRFVTYNILADLYADQDYSRQVLFAHCPPHSLEIDYRRQLLLKELHGYNADIICLQEVDRKEFTRTYEPYFKLVTKHASVFNTKGGEVAEGEATFFRESKFELIDSHRTILSLLIDPIAKTVDNGDTSGESGIPKPVPTEQSPEETFPNQDRHPILDDLTSQESKNLLAVFNDIKNRIKTNEKLMRRFTNRHTILQTTLLKCKQVPNTYVIVANTHLYFAPDADHIRVLQGSVCAKYIEYLKGYYQRLIELKLGQKDPKISVIFCGDFNSSPDCGLFKLMHEGKIDGSLKDWHSNEDEIIEGPTVESSLRFSSAYKDIPYTNYTPGFHGCLDYIYYELDGFECESTIPLPDHEDVTATGGLPSNIFPSDHLALIANFKFK